VSVLCISEAIDIHANALKWALGEMGVQLDILSTDEFPARFQTSVRLIPNGSFPSVNITELSDHKTFTSVWNRRPNRPKNLLPGLAPEDQAMALYEAHLFIESVKPILATSAVWINSFESRRLSESKLLQLQIAARCGLKIPDTLMSNDYSTIRDFLKEHQGEVIYKASHQAAWRRESSQTDYRIYTSKITPEDIEPPLSVINCPGTYQRLIPKQSELRITFFGATFFAMRIYSQQTAMGKLDWRSDVAREAITESVTLSETLVEQLREIVTTLGLLHGSVDIIEGIDGQLYFLEVNEMGQFLWLEDFHPDLRLLAAAAAFSLEPSEHFQMNKFVPVTLNMENYRRSEVFSKWLNVWNAYIEGQQYPLVYQE
jgi:hypothetical protein